MTSIRPLVFAAGSCLFLAACDQLVAYDSDKSDPAENSVIEDSGPSADMTEAVPALPERPVALASEATIDWEAARADMASTSSDEHETGFQVASGGSAPPVPVLLPTGIVIPQGAESGVRFQPVSDGYFATYPGVDYDIVVNGTNEVIRPENTTGTAEDSVLTFTPTMTGAQVSFSRYGADYLVEFECKSLTGDKADCISEGEALDVTEKLVIAGTR